MNSFHSANQGQGGQRATLLRTPTAAAGSKRGASSRGLQPTGSMCPRQDSDGGFLTRDDIRTCHHRGSQGCR